MSDEEKSLIDILLDPDSSEPIVFKDEYNQEISFEQVAVIPLDEGVYVILKPIDELEGVGSDEALVFRLDIDDEDNPELSIERNIEIAEQVFEKYYQLVDEANNE
ncbi:MAG: DUF1292 domain-containing protein [Christensenellales bacterium]|nr:DUF1292 domain-containing protein [Clostridiales bacterium]